MGILANGENLSSAAVQKLPIGVIFLDTGRGTQELI
jgi:hypothetical protein